MGAVGAGGAGGGHASLGLRPARDARWRARDAGDVYEGGDDRTNSRTAIFLRA